MGYLNLTSHIDGDTKLVATITDAEGHHMLVTAPLLEHLIEDGEVFVATDFLADLADAANRDYLIVTGDTEGLHLGMSFTVGADTTARIFRDTTHTGGAALTEFNRNQNDADGCGNIALTQGPGGGADGDQIFATIIPGGSKVNSSPGGGRGWAFGWLLESNTSYLVRLTNISGAATPVSTQFDLHLHEV